MKIKIITLINALLLAMLTFGVTAQQDCGAIDCRGACGRFVDADGDGFCDHGQLSKPAEPTQPESQAKQSKTKKLQTDTLSKPSNLDTQVTPSCATESIESNTIAPTDTPIPQVSEEPIPAANTSPIYPVLPICGGLLILYFTTLFFVKKDLITKLTHRKIWNIALTITFLISCLLGIVLALFINYNYHPHYYLSFLHWHVYFGIGMTIIALIHMIWHWNYYKNIFKKQ